MIYYFELIMKINVEENLSRAACLITNPGVVIIQRILFRIWNYRYIFSLDAKDVKHNSRVAKVPKKKLGPSKIFP